MFPYRSIAFFSFTPLEDISRRLISVDEYFTAEKKQKQQQRDKSNFARAGCALSLQKFPLSHEHSVHTIAPSFAQWRAWLNQQPRLPLALTHTQTTE